MRQPIAFLLLSLFVSTLSSIALAQWQPDGVAVSAAPSDQFSPSIVADGTGGAILTWYDFRGGTSSDIYIQRLNASGVPQWTADGVALCTAAGDQYYTTIVSDGDGGAIVTWEDRRNGTNSDIYAQRVSASGVPQWTFNGVALCTATAAQELPGSTSPPNVIVADGAGGAIVTWQDLRNGATWDIYAQRVNASGVPQWSTDGTVVCIAANAQFDPAIAPDGTGGAIIAWRDYRGGINYDIYVQRVDAAGAPQWIGDGVALCTDADEQSFPVIASDHAGGAIITWSDARSTPYDIYAQRVNAAGLPQWTADGVALCAAGGYQQLPRIVSDGAGGAIVTWFDGRSGDADVYAQRVSSVGVPQWTADGVALCGAGGNQSHPQIASDGDRGAIVAWVDARSGLPDYDTYVQRVNAAGLPQWTTDGVALCTAPNHQTGVAITLDGGDGAIVAWYDFRSGTNSDIYAQHVTDPPIAVAILSFDAVEVGGVVTLRSAFRSNLGVEAVNVYRDVGDDGDPLTIIERVDNIRRDGFEYVDRGVAPGQTYRYRIGVVDTDSEFFSQIVTVSVGAIAAELSQNQPNPFNPTTTIRYTLPVREDVALAIYDTKGRLIRTLVNKVGGYGAHEVTWDGRDDNGAAVGSGVYFYRLHAGKHTESRKMVLLK